MYTAAAHVRLAQRACHCFQSTLVSFCFAAPPRTLVHHARCSSCDVPATHCACVQLWLFKAQLVDAPHQIQKTKVKPQQVHQIQVVQRATFFSFYDADL
jgi:hypothetical protein